jgi:biotin carboxyl carrier protein
MMRRYTLNISDREFVVDVQEVDADHFEVVVGDETYQVNLASDESLAGAVIAPGLAAQAAPAASPARKAAAPSPRPAPAASTPAASTPARPAPGGGKGAQTAPMPGVVIEVNVKPGDTVTRGQQVAILDAMKMHNVIGAARAGAVAEVYMSAGQSVDHGTPLLKFQED